MRSTRGTTRIAQAVQWSVALVVLLATVVLLAGLHVAEAEVSPAIQFLLAMTVLSLLDVLLPHGGSVDVDAPLVVAALYLFGPGITAVIVIVSRLVAHLLRTGLGDLKTLLSGLVKRLAAIIAATGTIGVLQLAPVPSLGPYVEVAGLGIIFIFVQLLVGQLDLVVARSDSLLRTVRGNVALQGSVLAASVSIAVLTVVIHDGMGASGLVVTLFLVATMRQSFALLLDVRQAYQATIETLMSAMEIQSPEESGIGERTARLARVCGAEMGWYGSRIERMGYAALLLHYGLPFGRLDETTGEEVPTPLSEVDFLKPVEPMLRIVRGGDESMAADGRDAMAAYLVSKAFGHVQGYHLQATARIGEHLGETKRRSADKAFQRALAKMASL